MFFDGTIDTINRYAWSENVGWIDFGTTEGNVHVKDAELTGYAWGELVGWVSLNCSNDSSCGTVDYKVTNNGQGVLGGYAWSENAGWIDFNPTNGGVTINSSGVFSGYAWGELVGWIVFNCSDENSCATIDYFVSTFWRPFVHGSGGNDRGRGGGGGGKSEPTPPPEPFVPDYSGIAERRLAAQKRAEEEVNISEEEKMMKRRLSGLHERLVAHFKNQLARAEAAKNEKSIFEKLVENEELGLREVVNDTRKRMLRAIAKTKLQVSVVNNDSLKSSEEDGLLVSMIDGVGVKYEDVPTRAWYAPYVSLLLEEDIASGYKDEEGNLKGEFGVSNPVTRAEVIKMALEVSTSGQVVKLYGVPRNISAQGTWASAYVAKAEEMNISTFGVDVNVNENASRGEVVQTILEVIKLGIGNNPSSYSDVSISHPYSNAIDTASYFGIISGDEGANTFRPNDEINRAEVAKIIAMVMEFVK
ncbi:MAG: S-layer homology domain-containing protein [Candidatus Peribacteraceae bacterium]|nr:S-layer homology domain-containing protein [Candidatus Peribacteraceae bacterium]